MTPGSLLSATFLLIALVASLFVAPAFATPPLSFNFFIPTLTITFVLGEFRLAFAAAIIGGFFFDLIAATPFGTYLASFTIGLAGIRWMARTRITNRSIPAYLALVAIGTSIVGIGVLLFGSLAKLLPSEALPPNIHWSSLTAIAADIIQNLMLSIIVLAALRLTRGSYARLMDQEF